MRAGAYFSCDRRFGTRFDVKVRSFLSLTPSLAADPGLRVEMPDIVLWMRD